jgi:hypothetical protein
MQVPRSKIRAISKLFMNLVGRCRIMAEAQWVYVEKLIFNEET